MSFNEGSQSYQKNDLYPNSLNNEENNEFAKHLNELSENYSVPDTICLINQISTINNSTINNLKNEIRENIFPYLNKDTIPEIKIKDENYFLSGDKIESYINTPYNINFNDNKYNICDKCRKIDNYYFCKNCQKNFCINCSEDCFFCIHKLLKLQIIQDEIKYYRRDIMRIINEYFIEPEKKEKIYEKELKSYKVIDTDKIIDDKTIENIKLYTYDILLIENIIEKNYNNYFHYINIKNCYKYMQKKYDVNNQIIIEYKIQNEDKKIRIFGDYFVKNNKIKCLIICDDSEFELDEYFALKNFVNNKILKIKLIGINNITNMECMFYECSSLESISNISKWNTGDISNMEFMFYGCNSLKTLPDISKWNTNNVTNLRYIFGECSSLVTLPDISNWNTSKVDNMGYMFYRCSSLVSLPDISNWNISNVINMRDMFYGCCSLKSLPDLSKWNTSNVINMEYMFYGCCSLKSLPDISNWNTCNVTNMEYMFYKCSLSISLPDISKWNLSNVTNMRDLFN